MTRSTRLIVRQSAEIQRASRQPVPGRRRSDDQTSRRVAGERRQVQLHRARDPVAEPDRHGQRAGQGAAALGVQPDRPRGGRPRQRRVRPAGPHGRPGRHRHARSHQLARHGRRQHPRRVPARHARAGRRAHHQRPVQDRRANCSTSPCWCRCGATAGDRAVRLDDPPHRRRRLRHRRRRPRRVRGRAVDPDRQADEARRAQRRRVEVHPLQRPPARPHGRRPARPDGVRRGRAPSASWRCATSTASTTSRLSPTRSSTAREAATRASDPGAARRHVPARRRCSTSPTAARSRSSARSRSTPTPARSPSTTPASSAPARGASTSSRTTPTPTRRSPCARCSAPRSPTTTAAWRRSR